MSFSPALLYLLNAPFILITLSSGSSHPQTLFPTSLPLCPLFFYTFPPPYSTHQSIQGVITPFYNPVSPLFCYLPISLVSSDSNCCHWQFEAISHRLDRKPGDTLHDQTDCETIGQNTPEVAVQYNTPPQKSYKAEVRQENVARI